MITFQDKLKASVENALYCIYVGQGDTLEPGWAVFFAPMIREGIKNIKDGANLPQEIAESVELYKDEKDLHSYHRLDEDIDKST